MQQMSNVAGNIGNVVKHCINFTTMPKQKLVQQFLSGNNHKSLY